MSKILAVGTGPLLESGVRMLGAHCLRTWSLVKPLADVGHEVALFTAPIFDPEKAREMEQAGVLAKSYHGFDYRAFRNADETYNLRELESFCREFKPNAILGINSGPAALAARIHYPAPLWADLFGHVMGEGTGKSFAMQANTHLHYFWNMEEAVLRRADHFSVSSRRQGFAVYGELGAMGRLNRHTFQYEFTSFIPPAFDPFHAQMEESRPSNLLQDLPDDAFVVLWSGGFNTWTNVDSLARALERVMEQCPALHFVSTGGALAGFDELTYPRFASQVEQSANRSRYHLLGWVDSAELPGIYGRSHLAICVDSHNVETRFGTRTRIVNLIASGVPVLATRGSELVEDLEAMGVVMACGPDDPEQLAAGILNAYSSGDYLAPYAAQARENILRNYSLERVSEPLRRWAEQPRFAPDNQAKLERAKAEEIPWDLTLSPLERRSRPSAPKVESFAEFLKAKWRLKRPMPRAKTMAIRDLAPPDIFDRIVAASSQGAPIRLISDGCNAPALEHLCCRLLDEALPVPLECAIEIRSANPNAFYALALLKNLPELYPGRFRLVAAVGAQAPNREELLRTLREVFCAEIEGE